MLPSHIVQKLRQQDKTKDNGVDLGIFDEAHVLAAGGNNKKKKKETKKESVIVRLEDENFPIAGGFHDCDREPERGKGLVAGG